MLMTFETLSWARAELDAMGVGHMPDAVWDKMLAGAQDDYRLGRLPALTVPPQYLPPHNRGPRPESGTATPAFLRVPDKFIVEDK